MKQSESDLPFASHAVSLALHHDHVDPTTIYPYVAALAHRHTQTLAPVIFWRKWGRTTGLQFVPGDGDSGGYFVEFGTKDTNGRQVIFVEGQNPSVNDIHDYLLYGVDFTRVAGAAGVGLITSRRHYTDTQLDAMGRAIDWVLVSDVLSDQQYRIDARAGAGRFASFPHLRRQPFYNEGIRSVQ